jgi:choline dehydrogenase-like flavoprotein
VVSRYTSGVPGTGEADMQLIATNFGVLNLDAASDDPTFAIGGVVIVLNEVFSQGRLRIVDADAGVEPAVEENMAADPRDLARLVDAAVWLLAIEESTAVMQAAVDGEPVGLARSSPGTGIEGGDVVTKATWDRMSTANQEAWVHIKCADSHYALGTCRLGRAGDPAAVVDLEGRVIGVPGLSIVDASIMPSSVRGNIHLTVLMLAELMADKLKQQLAVAEVVVEELEAEGPSRL